MKPDNKHERRNPKSAQISKPGQRQGQGRSGGMPPKRYSDSEPEIRQAEHDSSPAAILKALEEHEAMRSSQDARKHPRRFLCVPAMLQIHESADPGAPVRNAAVATNNISEGGFGFIFDAPISPGTLIRVTFESLAGKPTIAGVVRSSVRICGTQHRIGVEFNPR